MLSLLTNLFTPFTIAFSYAAVGTWLLGQSFISFSVEDKDSDKGSEISVDEKIDEQIDSLIDRENEELRMANQQWFEKYEELYAKNKELKSQIKQARTMLCTAGCISMIMLSSYSMIAYAHILTAGLAK